MHEGQTSKPCSSAPLTVEIFQALIVILALEMAFLVASLALEVGQLVFSMVPSLTPSPDTTKISIAIGHSDTDDTLGGNAPYVTLWENNGDLIGDYEPKRNKVWAAGQTSKWATDTHFCILRLLIVYP